jgi:hypothetical protein
MLMAQGRMLLKRISMSDKVNRLSCDTARLLYTWMIAHLDKNGCFYANPTLVKNIVFPHREDLKTSQIEKYLSEMEQVGLLVRYQDNGNYLCYPDFEEKQPYLRKDKEGREEIPKWSGVIPDQVGSNSVVTPVQNKIKYSKVKEEMPRKCLRP